MTRSDPRTTADRPNTTQSLLVPSLRLISIAVLVGLGASVAGLSGLSQADGSGATAASALLNSKSAAAPSPSATTTAGALDVRAENLKAGTPGWQISPARGTHAGLEAYAGAVSVRPGEPVPLAVNGEGSVRVRALRIGWYDGIGARQVWAGTLSAQPESVDPGQWPVRGQADTTGWPEGHYLLRLDQGPASRYLPLTVRSADSRGRILVLTSPLTWQAENTDLTGGTEQRTASFDRPYAAGYGSGGFLADDEGIVQQAERTGKRLAYGTDYDVSSDPALLTKATAVLTGSDSRFWTSSLRSAIAKAGEAGTNLAFFGSGAGSRKVSLTGQGRVLSVSAGAPSDSLTFTGLRPSCAASVPAAWTVSNADWWGYQGTGVHTGDLLPGLIGAGADRASTRSAGSPSPMQVLSFTQITCTTADGASQPGVQSAVYQARSSGAGVFVAGTGRWACVVVNSCLNENGKPISIDPATQRFASRVTRTVVTGFATTRAGKRYPATNSASQYANLR